MEFSNDKTCHSVEVPIKYSWRRARDERFFLRFTRRNKMSFSVSLGMERRVAALFTRKYDKNDAHDRLFDAPLINYGLSNALSFVVFNDSAGGFLTDLLMSFMIRLGN